MSALEELRRRVPPPALPFPPAGDWSAAEEALGTPLPADFKQLVELYGSGELCGHLHWLNPFADPSMRADAEELLAAYRQVREAMPEDCPWPAFPEPGGLLPWAMTADGEELYWVTEGDPDRWKTLAGEPPDVALHDVGATQFLVQWLDGSCDPSIRSWPELEPGLAPFFRPRVPAGARESLTVHFGEAVGPYADRLRVVLEVFAPARRRRRGLDVGGVVTQISATEDGWELSYSSREPEVPTVAAMPAQMLGILLPPEDLEKAKEKVIRLSAALEAPITHASAFGRGAIWTDVTSP